MDRLTINIEMALCNEAENSPASQNQWLDRGAALEWLFSTDAFCRTENLSLVLSSHLQCCRLEDKSAMDNVFTVGEVVPYSGVYRITHYPPHTGEEALMLTKGSTFPQCAHCCHASFMLMYQLTNSELLTLNMIMRRAADGIRRIRWQETFKIAPLPPTIAKTDREVARSNR